MASSNVRKYSCEGTILDGGDGEFVVKGFVQALDNHSKIMFWAANPPTYNTSYSGSGLPFPNKDIAYYNTPNRGSVHPNGGYYEFHLRYPNSYYVALGTVLVEPCVHIKVCDTHGSSATETISLGNGIPFRFGSHQYGNTSVTQRTSPEFYAGGHDLPIRTQEEILKICGYPSQNIFYPNFWGDSPPV
tara:strand:+ start:5921 stop:6484 length:564 start_codon:yes stop_codon:yes gene_type:complete